MALIRKRVTRRLAAANRANSLKSTGPRTMTGKIQSSHNSIKSGIHSNPLLARLKGLGEDPVEFEELHGALLHAFVPSDTFEQMLVEDMAVLRWRRLRLCRAEVEAWDRHKMLSIEKHLVPANLASDEDGGKAANEEVLSHARKFQSWMEEAPERFGSLSCPHEDRVEFTILVFALWGFAADFKGFNEAGIERLKTLYGPQPGLAGSTLLTRYEEYLREEERADATERAKNRESFLQALNGEVSFYFRLDNLMRRAEKEGRKKAAGGPRDRSRQPQGGPDREVEIERIEGGLGVVPGGDIDKVMRYEAHLERQFERKLQQLVAWRRAKEEAVSSAPASLGVTGSRSI